MQLRERCPNIDHRCGLPNATFEIDECEDLGTHRLPHSITLESDVLIKFFSSNKILVAFRYAQPGMTFMNPASLTDADYDEKLREMGNYLWDLEQEADRASAEGRQSLVE